MVYRCDKQTSKLSQQLKHFYSCGEFCDVILYSKSSQIHAHRLILAAFSPYFYHCIHRNTDRRNVAEIQLRSYDDRIVKSIVDFFYNGVITVDSDSAEQIFSLANTLQVKEVEKLCLTFLNAQQSFASEIEDRKPHFDTEIGRYSIVEPSKVESSSRSSPRTSPSVSTSGRPLSDSGSVETVDSDVVNIKTEVQDFSYEALQDDYREYYREGRKKDSEGKIKLTKTVVDMSHIQPKLTGQSVNYSQQYMFVRPSQPPPPPTLQMMAPQRDTEKSNDAEMSEPNNSSSTSAKNQQYQSSEEGSADASQQDSDLFPGTLEAMFECQICKQMFVAKHLLEMHMMGIHGFSNLLNHQQQKKRQRVSPGEVSPDFVGGMQCDTCGKYFRDAQSLKFHKYNHILRFSCNVCGKRFSRSWNLHRHRKTHVRYGEVILDSGEDDSMMENMSTEYVDEISSEMVDLTSNVEDDADSSLSSMNTSQDIPSEKGEEEKKDEEKVEEIEESALEEKELALEEVEESALEEVEESSK